MAKRVSLSPGPDNNHVAGIHPPRKLPVHQRPEQNPPRAQGNHDEENAENYDASRHFLCLDQVQSSGQQQPAHQACLHAQPLLMQMAGQPERLIEVHPPADHNQGDREADQNQR